MLQENTTVLSPMPTRWRKRAQ